jgi:uracil-DNA glycosylase family 4
MGGLRFRAYGRGVEPPASCAEIPEGWDVDWPEVFDATDSWDEPVDVLALSDDWQGHPKGAILVLGESRFWVQERLDHGLELRERGYVGYEGTATQAKCDRCPALCGSRQNIVEGFGPVAPLIAVVGEAPGREEDKAAIPFVGASGKLLRAVLGEIGLVASEVFYTNAVRCRPEDNRTPTREEWMACGSWLKSELERVRPVVVVAMGRTAADAVNALGIEAEYVYHPAYIMRQGHAKREAWKAELQAIVRRARGESEPVAEVAEPWWEGPIDWAHPALAVDTETDSLTEGYGERLVMAQVSDGTGAQVYLEGQVESEGALRAIRDRHVYLWNAKYDAPLLGVDLGDAEKWDDPALMAYVLRYERVGLKELGPKLTGLEMRSIKELLQVYKQTGVRRNGSVIKHKGKTNKPWHAKIGKGTHSTSYHFYKSFATEDEANAALDVALAELGLPRETPVYKWVKAPFSAALETRPEEARAYGMLDAVVTARAGALLERELNRLPVLRRYYDEFEKPCVQVLADMERVGVQIDPRELEPLSERLGREIAGADARAREVFGVDPAVNLGSPEQVCNVLMELGYSWKKHTPSGMRLSTDEATLLSLTGYTVYDDPGQGGLKQALEAGEDDRALSHFVGNLLYMREMAKLRSTYVDKLLRVRDQGDRVHARFNGMVTNTDRLSSSEPNLQNIPIRGTLRDAIRRVFVARDGCCFVKADFSQLEVRIYAHFTQEPVLLRAYQEGLDVHQSVADELGIPRWRAKNVLFAAIYGAAAAKLAQTAGVTDAREFLERLRVRLPSILNWHKKIAASLDTRGYVETLFGWRGYYPLWRSPLGKDRAASLREAGNLPIQGTASGIVKRLMIQAAPLARQYQADLVLQVHDEVVYEVPINGAKPFAAQLERLGANVCPELSVPLVFEPAIGPNWADVK